MALCDVLKEQYRSSYLFVPTWHAMRDAVSMGREGQYDATRTCLEQIV